MIDGNKSAGKKAENNHRWGWIYKTILDDSVSRIYKELLNLQLLYAKD